MGQPKAIVSVAALRDEAERIAMAATEISSTCDLLIKEGLAEARLPWTNAHWDAADKITESWVLLKAVAQTEIAAFKTGRVSKAARTAERSQRDYAKKKLKMQQEGATPRKRGRPRKKAE